MTSYTKSFRRPANPLGASARLYRKSPRKLLQSRPHFGSPLAALRSVTLAAFSGPRRVQWPASRSVARVAFSGPRRVQ